MLELSERELEALKNVESNTELMDLLRPFSCVDGGMFAGLKYTFSGGSEYVYGYIRGMEEHSAIPQKVIDRLHEIRIHKCPLSEEMKPDDPRKTPDAWLNYYPEQVRNYFSKVVPNEKILDTIVSLYPAKENWQVHCLDLIRFKRLKGYFLYLKWSGFLNGDLVSKLITKATKFVNLGEDSYSAVQLSRSYAADAGKLDEFEEKFKNGTLNYLEYVHEKC